MIEIRQDEVVGTENVSQEQLETALADAKNEAIEIHKTETSYKQRLLELQRKLNKVKKSNSNENSSSAKSG